MSITITETNKRRNLDQILDVRENFEITEGMIPEAVHIPMGDLNFRFKELDQNRPVIVVCRSGNRSTQVANALKQAGYTAYSMTGGMSAWYQNNLPIK
ncbi:rhodanese-like domain-containing protein [Corynebacterium glutamicum]|uniref:rhodanese-like domain-containing protein n=1 Tax=Corynebacterium glutamicum TaxID=1718 RepID=UPI000744A321|nr:rhodanese-like domain-containing protein [Corynebacterium glutamicum]ALZ98831.1 sulfurtransferase [Corynebacterium glutamicum]